MSEDVFNILQLGRQAGSFTAPGAAVPATFKFPVEEVISPELDRGSAFSKQDVGRNSRNRSGSGYHGVRAATASLSSQVRFEDIMDLLEMSMAGGVTPSGSNPYTWLYPFEVGAPTLKPYTAETGNIDSASSQARLTSMLISQLELSFDALSAPGASPWMAAADLLAIDRDIAAVTAALNPRTGMEVAQGHLTRLYEGAVGTAFASLTELAASLKAFTATWQRNLTLRAYGSASDLATTFGFTEQSSLSGTLQVGISTTAKTDFHDIWNVASPASLGERRWRLKCAGSGTKVFQIDLRAGITAVPYDENDGERLFSVDFEGVDDSTLDAMSAITVINAIATL